MPEVTNKKGAENMLINKPQFDPTGIKVGDAVEIRVNSSMTRNYNTSTQYDKFNSYDNVLVIVVNPLSLVVLTSDKKEAKIDVEDVASEKIKLVYLVPRVEVNTVACGEPLFSDIKPSKVKKTTRKIKDGSEK
jgi:hypothetical protein